MSPVLNYSARSDRGLVRGNNEDSVYAGARLLALADGMGGHAAGEVASQIMIAAMAPLDDDEPGADLTGKLADAVRIGNATIADSVEHDPELEGMGTTLTAILFGGTKLGLAHVGDSRAYLLRDEKLTQITKDDTFVQSLVDEGRITKEQAHVHPQRSLIMRALTGVDVDPTLTVREVRVNDRYLLCSDGLSDVVSEETIAATMRTGTHEQCADRLVELALRGGGPDNVTVIVADVLELDYGDTDPIVAGAASEIEEPPALPDTAAGRAAALSQPIAKSRRIPAAEVAPAPTSKRNRRGIVVASIAAALVLMLAGAAALSYAWRNYYYADSTASGHVTLKRGWNFSSYVNRTVGLACLNGTTLTFTDGSACIAPAKPLRVTDFQLMARTSVPSGYRGSEDEVEALLRNLPLRPLCTPPAPAPAPAPAPEPAPVPAPEPTPSAETTEVPPPAPEPPLPPAPAPPTDCR